MFIRSTLLVLIFIPTISAKSGIIAGRVTDTDTGEPLIGANILILNTNWGAATEMDGSFTIKNVLPGRYSLRASYVGYAPQEIEKVEVKSGDSLYFEFKFKSDFTLSEVMVVESRPLVEQKSTNSCRIISSDNIHRLPIRGVESQIHVRGGRSGDAMFFLDETKFQAAGYESGFNQYHQSAPWNTEEYSTIVENEFLNAFTNPLSTFSIDVDAASYSNTRRFIQSGQLPPKDAVRVEEFINYFDYDHPQPNDEKPFSVFTELGACPWNEENYLLHIGINGKEISIVVSAGLAGLVLPVTKGNEKEKIITALNKLHAGGSTAGGAGIQLAYKIAKKNFLEGGNNRIILATDGDFNVGVSNTSELVEMIENKRDEGIYLTILGFGIGNYKDGRLEELADKGNGDYYYVDNILEAKKVFDYDLIEELADISLDEDKYGYQDEFLSIVKRTKRLSEGLSLLDEANTDE